MTTFESVIKNHLSYNTYSNTEFCKWLEGLPEHFLTNRSEGNSVIQIIQHMSRIQLFWKKFLNGESIDNFLWTIDLLNTHQELENLVVTSMKLHEKCISFSDQELCTLVHFKTEWAENKLERIYYILHCVNHNTHHRGQIISKLRQIGYTGEVPSTEYSIFIGSSK